MNSKTFAFMSIAYLFSIGQSKKKKSGQLQVSKDNQDLFEYIFIGLGVIALLGALIYLLNRRSQLMRAEKLRSIKRSLQVKQQTRKNKPCTMTQMQKDENVSWFLKQNWVLQQYQGKQKSSKLPLQIVSLKRKQQPVDGSKYLKDYYDAFYVQMKGGSAKIFGVIMFEKYYMTFLFDKSFSSSKNQNGTYDYKFFDGSLKKGQFQGRWYTSNDTKIEFEREALKQKQKQKNSGDEPVSERSFSKGDRQSDDSSSPTILSKTLQGSFKLYHQ